MNVGDTLIEVRLTSIRYAAKDTHLYEFSRLDGQVLPTVEPGAHIDIYLPNGLVRQYSLVAADFAPQSYIVGIKRDPKSRGGSVFIHDQLKVGTLLKISFPRNNFHLIENESMTVLIAGGIGITPIYCMVNRLLELGRPWRLYYSCRSRADAAFFNELSPFDCVTFNFDDENGGKFLDLDAIVRSAPVAAHFYCCGPLPMLHAFEAATENLPSEHRHVEYFSADTEIATEGGFVVELARSKREFFVPIGKTILEVLREGGINVDFSCEAGICGACETKVVSGTPDHRDVVLDDAEHAKNQVMMICCSGCKSDRLILDL